MPFASRSVRLAGRITLAGPVEEVFPLFSPLGEKLWVPDWNPELLHPPGASWEPGLIFRTQEETGEAVWIQTRLDRAAHAAEYYRVEPGRYVARVEVRCAGSAGPAAAIGSPTAAGPATVASIVYDFIGLSERGNADIAAMTPASYEQKMERWTCWIDAYLAGRTP